MFDDDDDDEEEEDCADEVMEPEKKKDKPQQQQRGSRLSDQVDMDDEPALVGYERCVVMRCYAILRFIALYCAV